jgi:hypothetical protein
MRRRGWARLFARDWVITLLVVLVYFLARGQAGGDQQLAINVTEALIEFERSLHMFWEPTIQQATLQAHWIQELANAVYAYLHFPVLIAVGLWLWFKRRAEFLFMRSVMFISMVFGLAFYYFLPAAPPRLLSLHGYDFGFVDTVFGGNTNISYAQPSYLLNEYAAIPSFHFGWIAMASAAVWVNTKSRWLRGVAVLLSVVMAWAIVASANHFFIDMILGGLVVAVSWGIARYLERRKVHPRSIAVLRQADALPSSRRLPVDVARPFAAAGVVAPGLPLL